MTRVLYDLESGVPGVRCATADDETDLFILLLLLHRENGIFGLNEEKVIKGIRYATGREGGIIFCIDEDQAQPHSSDNHVVASLGMCVTTDWYSDDPYLLERWNYVHPEHRRSDYARKLLEQAKWSHHWFKQPERDAPLNMPFQCGINSFDRTEAKVRLYARHMPCIGACFLYGAPPLQADKYQKSMREIEDMARRIRGLPSPQNRKVVPLVETILREGQRDVRQGR
jgi:GNAT superfamily N-acetyltransferase